MIKLFSYFVFVVLLSYSCKSTSYYKFDTTTGTKIVAHRGFSSIAPENTLSAFQKAIEAGVPYFELDVHKSKDGHLFVIHDDKIERTTSSNNTGEVHLMTGDDIAKIKVGYTEKFGNQFLNEKIPLLTEALQLAKGKIKVCIEIKVLDIEEDVLNLINKLEMNDEVIIFSFHYEVLSRIRQLDKNIPILYLKDCVDKVTFDYAKLLNAQAVGVGYCTHPTKDLIQYAHNKGIEVWKWTVNEEQQMYDLLKMKLDGLITNFPQKALEIRNSINH